MDYETFDHTADLGVRVFGKTREALYANAAKAMFDLIADIKTIRPVGELEVEVFGQDDVSLMVNWLSELLVVHEVEGFLLSEFDVKLEGHTLRATVRGEPLDRDRHELRRNIKAVSYHKLLVNSEEGFVQVIFDI